MTWHEVDVRARALAAALRGQVLAGERAAVLVPHGLDYVVAMLGAFYARVVAIPLFTPDLPGHSGRLLHILADADPACVLTTGAAAASLEALLGQGAARPRRTIAVDAVPAALADDWQEDEIAPGDLAYLQYTSGSTRAPAGVMITHGCLAANAAQIIAALENEAYRSTGVGWLPLFHDMGFVMTVAMPIAAAGHAAFMDPVAFLMRPARWLQLASEHTSVFTADRAALQRGQAVVSDGAGAIPMASCGSPAGQHVVIVDPQTAAVCPPGRIGEIWVNGPNVSPGYFRRPSSGVGEAVVCSTGVCSTGTFGAVLAVAPEGLPRGGEDPNYVSA